MQSLNENEIEGFFQEVIDMDNKTYNAHYDNTLRNTASQHIAFDTPDHNPADPHADPHADSLQDTVVMGETEFDDDDDNVPEHEEMDMAPGEFEPIDEAEMLPDTQIMSSASFRQLANEFNQSSPPPHRIRGDESPSRDAPVYHANVNKSSSPAHPIQPLILSEPEMSDRTQPLEPPPREPTLIIDTDLQKRRFDAFLREFRATQANQSQEY